VCGGFSMRVEISASSIMSKLLATCCCLFEERMKDGLSLLDRCIMVDLLCQRNYDL
jgi:hypothetical protein